MRRTLTTSVLMFGMSLILVGTTGATVLNDEQSAMYNGKSVKNNSEGPSFAVLPLSSQLAIKEALRSVW